MTAEQAGGFAVVYEDVSPMPIRLEAAVRRDAQGGTYRHHRLVIADGRPGSVIIATRGDELLLVRSYRVALDTYLWEVPRGVGEISDAEHTGAPGEESPAARTGHRELLEETGYAARRVALIGEYVTDSAIFPQRVGVVHCEIAPDAISTHTDGEVDEVRWYSMSRIIQMMRSGTIRDAHSLAALSLWLTRGSDD